MSREKAFDRIGTINWLLNALEHVPKEAVQPNPQQVSDLQDERDRLWRWVAVVRD